MGFPLAKHMSVKRFRGRYVLRALVDMVGIFVPFKETDKPASADGKRILVFNWRDMKHTYAGGAEVYVQELAKRWVGTGNHVTMFCGNDGNAPREEIIDGIHIIRRGGFYFVFIWAFFYYMFRFRKRFDVIVDCHNGIPFFTPLYAREPVVCVVHHIHQEVFKQHLGKAQATLAMWLEAKLMPRAYNQSQYVAVSPSTAQEMEGMGMRGKGIEIVYNGVDLANLTPGIKDESPLVVFLGRIQPYKSIDVLINAFKAVQAKVPDARLVIAGAGEAEDSLKELVREQHMTGTISFTGRVTEPQKLELLQKAWVAANPSLMEGWGITTIEANACGTPVVGADVPGLRDSIKHESTGFLVPHGSTHHMAERITEFLKDHHLREDISRQAHEWSQQFQWDVSSNQMMALLDRTQDEHKSMLISSIT